MNLSTLQKIGGVSIIVGSILFFAWTILWTTLLPVNEITKDFSLLVLSPNWIWITSILFPGTIFMIFGFTAVYSRMYKSAGIIGFLGYIFIILAYILQTALISWELFLYPVIAHNEASVFLLKNKVLFFSSGVTVYRTLFQASIAAGIILFCLTLLRNRDFPKISGALIFLGAVAYTVGPMVHIFIEIAGVAVLSAGCFILGNTMLSNRVTKDV